MQYLVNLHSSRKPGTSSAIYHRNRNDETSTFDTKLSHRGQHLHGSQFARDRQPRTRAPEGAGERRLRRARKHTRSAMMHRLLLGPNCAQKCWVLWDTYG
eukprot:6188059-Pleurochrysis_carterae.AAC.2